MRVNGPFLFKGSKDVRERRFLGVEGGSIARTVGAITKFWGGILGRTKLVVAWFFKAVISSPVASLCWRFSFPKRKETPPVLRLCIPRSSGFCAANAVTINMDKRNESVFMLQRNSVVRQNMTSDRTPTMVGVIPAVHSKKTAAGTGGPGMKNIDHYNTLKQFFRSSSHD